jgi:hypothetical protein
LIAQPSPNWKVGLFVEFVHAFSFFSSMPSTQPDTGTCSGNACGMSTLLPAWRSPDRAVALWNGGRTLVPPPVAVQCIPFSVHSGFLADTSLLLCSSKHTVLTTCYACAERFAHHRCLSV